MFDYNQQLLTTIVKMDSSSSSNKKIRTRFKVNRKFSSWSRSRLANSLWKMNSKVIYSLLLLTIFLESTVISQPLLQSSSLAGSNPTCQQSIEHCYGNSRFGSTFQISSPTLDSMSCQQIRVLKQCLKPLKIICNGSLMYHSWNVIIPTYQNRCRKNQQQQTRTPPTRSMLSGQSWHQQLSPSSSTTNDYMVKPNLRSSLNQRSQPQYIAPMAIKPEYCLLAAYNFTIGLDVVPYRKQNVLYDMEQFLMQQPNRHRQKRSRDSNVYNYYSKTLTFKLNETAQIASDMIYKPTHPMTPSLTCIIFGDPHLRTFDSQYQTCNCLGARSLLEHPLFDVQITNSRLQDQFNTTGVTKVTVLVRKFQPCALSHELIYETDSLTQSSPSGTFNDGSIYNFKDLVYITTSLNNMVVTIHLEHIGVRVYISQFVHTKFLNVVIKFRTAKSNHIRQDLVLQAINPISLCKTGCHQREWINITNELKRANIDTNDPQNVKTNKNNDPDSPYYGQSSNSLDQQSDVDDEENSDDYYDDNQDDDYDNYDDDDLNNNEEDDDGIPKRKQRKTLMIRKRRDLQSDENEKKKKNRKGRNRSKNQQPVLIGSVTTTTTEQSIQKPNNRRQKKKNRKGNNNPPLRSALVMDVSASIDEKNYHENHNDVEDPKSNSPSLMEIFSMNKFDKQREHDQSTVTLNGGLEINDCFNNALQGYYRLACLYDTMIKGTNSPYPFLFASSFDEPRFITRHPSNSSGKLFQMEQTTSSSNCQLPSQLLLLLLFWSLLLLR